MNKSKWAAKIYLERKYKKAIEELIINVDNYSKKGIVNPSDYLLRIQQYAKTDTFLKLSWNIAQNMITQLHYDNARTWRAAAKGSSKGREIYDLLKQEMQGTTGDAVREIINRNAEWIRSIPTDMTNLGQGIMSDPRQHMSEAAWLNYLSGNRHEDLINILLAKTPRLGYTRAELIARTETSKAQSALTKVRAQSLGLNWYIWETAEDRRVRSAHAHMQGVLVCFDNPPSPEKLIGAKDVGKYNAGDIYNCRCYAAPLVGINDVKWPCKVYHNGVIQRMSKTQFLQISKMAA